MERNTALLEQTMHQIIDHPEDHNQGRYFNTCGTPSCYAGWAIHLSGYKEAVTRRSPYHILDDGSVLSSPGVFAANLLGLTEKEAQTLFAVENTRDMLELMVKDLLNGDELKSPRHYGGGDIKTISQRVNAIRIPVPSE